MSWTEKNITSKEMRPKENQSKPRDIREKSGNGFGMTIFPSGEKSFIYIYHFEGRKRRMTLGKYPFCSLAEARRLHREALEMLEKGKDPAFEKHQSQKTQQNALTTAELIEEYIRLWAKPRKRSWQEDERCLNKDVKPAFGSIKAKDVTRRDIILMLDTIKNRGAPIAANRTLACVRRMFNFAVERDIIEVSPCAAIKAVAKENRRDRVLTLEEIKTIWEALSYDDTPTDLHIVKMATETRLAIKFQLVTAQRKGEVLGAEWSEIDLVHGWWTIPADKAKNGNAHRIPLSSLALQLLHDIKCINPNTKYLFPAQHNDKPMAGTSIDHAIRRSHFEGVDPWTPHDLRRSAASHMTSMGISRLIISKILNHTDSTVTAVYDRYEYENEKQHALNTWAQRLEILIDETDEINRVISIKKSA